MSWEEDIVDFEAAISELTVTAEKIRESVSLSEADALIVRCCSEESLRDLYSVKAAYLKSARKWTGAVGSPVFSAINSILRPASHAGTARRQYVLPDKTKARVISPYDALRLQAEIMTDDAFSENAYGTISR